MAKIIRVENCKTCPKLLLEWEEDGLNFCDFIKKKNLSMERRVLKSGRIPKWCPLPDAKEVKDV